MFQYQLRDDGEASDACKYIRLIRLQGSSGHSLRRLIVKCKAYLGRQSRYCLTALPLLATSCPRAGSRLHPRAQQACHFRLSGAPLLARVPPARSPHSGGDSGASISLFHFFFSHASNSYITRPNPLTYISQRRVNCFRPLYFPAYCSIQR